MPDPITLSSVGTAVLTEGVKFLYKQAGEILKRWMKRGETREAAAQTGETEALELELSNAFDGQLVAPKIHFKAVKVLENELRELRKGFTDYIEEIDEADYKDEDFLSKIDALRQCVEAIYQQRLSFKGEERQPSGPVVEGELNVKQVAGYAAAVRAKTIASGEVKAKAEADRVETEGKFLGVDADKIG